MLALRNVAGYARQLRNLVVIITVGIAPALAQAIPKSKIKGTWDLTNMYCSSGASDLTSPAAKPFSLPRPQSATLIIGDSRFSLSLMYYGCRFDLESPYRLSGDVISYANRKVINRCNGSKIDMEPERFRVSGADQSLQLTTLRRAGPGGFCPTGQVAVFQFQRR